MDAEFEKKYHKMEGSYWWFLSRRDILLRLVKKLAIPADAEILELGCSAGSLLRALSASGFKNISGIDKSEKAVSAAASGGNWKAFKMDASSLFFGPETFDLIIASDILEHTEDDGPVFKEALRTLKKNGIFLVFVPAFRFLWSPHDEANHHFRRYSRKELLIKALEAGFSVERLSYWNFSLFFAALILKPFYRFFGKKKDHLNEVAPFVNSFLFFWLRVENSFLETNNFPAGLTLFCVLRKN